MMGGRPGMALSLEDAVDQLRMGGPSAPGEWRADHPPFEPAGFSQMPPPHAPYGGVQMPAAGVSGGVVIAGGVGVMVGGVSEPPGASAVLWKVSPAWFTPQSFGLGRE